MKQANRDKLIELGVLRERQRIIALLPEILKIGNIDYVFDLGQDEVNAAIALIKGENK